MSSSASGGTSRRIMPVLRRSSRVSALELFFDLVFVLAITQCTALIAREPTWPGVAKGMLVLALLWWAWSGYSWLTSALDPENDVVRLVVFVAMAAFLVVALCVPAAFDASALLFVCGYAVVRLAHLALFTVAGRRSPGLSRSVATLSVSSAIGVGVLLVAATTTGLTQGALWVAALVLDMGGPVLFGVGGWRIVPAHFAERFGLVVIIALGESIVAIGTGLHTAVDAGVTAAAVLGVVIAAAAWWLYFDVTATVAERRLSSAPPGAAQNALARDAYPFAHLPMVAGIVLLAVGVKKTLRDVGEVLDTVPAVALAGGMGLYLLGHVAFWYRTTGSFRVSRLVAAAVLGALTPVALVAPSLAALSAVAAVLVLLVVYERVRFRDERAQVRTEHLDAERSP